MSEQQPPVEEHVVVYKDEATEIVVVQNVEEL